MLSSDLFDWDNVKAESNAKKHGVIFEEAQTVFDDLKKTDMNETNTDELLPEYRFDYRKAKRNRFAVSADETVIVLAPDVAAYFKDSDSVNEMLRAIIGNMSPYLAPA